MRTRLASESKSFCRLLYGGRPFQGSKRSSQAMTQQQKLPGHYRRPEQSGNTSYQPGPGLVPLMGAGAEHQHSWSARELTLERGSTAVSGCYWMPHGDREHLVSPSMLSTAVRTKMKRRRKVKNSNE